jgi:hypothetical protein
MWNFRSIFNLLQSDNAIDVPEAAAIAAAGFRVSGFWPGLSK